MPPHAMPYRQATVCWQQGLEYGQPSNFTPLEQCDHAFCCLGCTRARQTKLSSQVPGGLGTPDLGCSLKRAAAEAADLRLGLHGRPGLPQLSDQLAAGAASQLAPAVQDPQPCKLVASHDCICVLSRATLSFGEEGQQGWMTVNERRNFVACCETLRTAKQGCETWGACTGPTWLGSPACGCPAVQGSRAA